MNKSPPNKYGSAVCVYHVVRVKTSNKLFEIYVLTLIALLFCPVIKTNVDNILNRTIKTNIVNILNLRSGVNKIIKLFKVAHYTQDSQERRRNKKSFFIRLTRVGETK